MRLSMQRDELEEVQQRGHGDDGNKRLRGQPCCFCFCCPSSVLSSTRLVALARRRPKSAAAVLSCSLLCVVLLSVSMKMHVSTWMRFLAMIVFTHMWIQYVWQRVFADPWLGLADEEADEQSVALVLKRFRRKSVLKYVYGIYLVLAFSSFFFSQFLAATEPNPLVIFTYNLVGSTMIFLTATVTLDLVYWTYSFCVHRKYVQDRDKTVVAQTRSIATAILYTVLSIASIVNGYSDASLVHVDIFLERLPPCLDGYKIGLLSDIHAGPLIGATAIQRQSELFMKESPDIVILGGDIADGPPRQVSGAVKPLVSTLTPRHGIYYVTGNHEYMHGATGVDWIEFWGKQEGVTVLQNNRTTIPPPQLLPASMANSYGSCNETFDLIGVPDLGADPNLDGATAALSSARESVLVAHQPLQALTAARKRIGLQLSGHTHAGQIFPLQFPVYAANRGLFAGLTSQEDMRVYISAGVTGWGPRTRLFSRNEQTIVRLKAGSGSGPSSGTGHLPKTSVTFGVVLSALTFVSCFGMIVCPMLTNLMRRRNVKHKHNKRHTSPV